MVDNMNPTSMTDAAVETPERTGLTGFLSSTVGKVVLGGVAIVVILGAAAGIFLTFFSGAQSTDSQTGGPAPVANVVTTTGTVPAVEESPTLRPARPLQDTFTFRNIFRPTISAPGTQTADSGSGSGTGTDSGSGSSDTSGTDTGSTKSYPADTLVLLKIETVDGEQKATFHWNGAEYTAGEGEQLGETPWRVVDISGDSVVMLFGDTRVTLSVGQGLSK